MTFSVGSEIHRRTWHLSNYLPGLTPTVSYHPTCTECLDLMAWLVTCTEPSKAHWIVNQDALIVHVKFRWLVSALQCFGTHLDCIWSPVRAGLLQKALLLCSILAGISQLGHITTIFLPFQGLISILIIDLVYEGGICVWSVSSLSWVKGSSGSIWAPILWSSINGPSIGHKESYIWITNILKWKARLSLKSCHLSLNACRHFPESPSLFVNVST